MTLLDLLREIVKSKTHSRKVSVEGPFTRLVCVSLWQCFRRPPLLRRRCSSFFFFVRAFPLFVAVVTRSHPHSVGRRVSVLKRAGLFFFEFFVASGDGVAL